MNRLLLSFRVIAILSIFISPVSWSASILHQQQSVSRDFTYLSFHDDGNDNAGPYVRADIVGGEHMSYVYVAGFAGQAYRIEFKSLDGDASAVVHGAGVRIERHADDISATKPLVVTAHVETDHSWIEVAMSAMTVGNYQLTIAKEIDHVSNNER